MPKKLSLLFLAAPDIAFHPMLYTTASRRLIGWNDRANKLKNESKFWYRVWVEAGYPTSGVLFQIKKNAKSRYKYEVRRLLAATSVP